MSSLSVSIIHQVFALDVKIKLNKEQLKFVSWIKNYLIMIFPQFWQSLHERKVCRRKGVILRYAFDFSMKYPQYHGRTLRGEWQWHPMGQKAYQLRRKLPLLLANIVVVGVVSALLIVSYAFSSLSRSFSTFNYLISKLCSCLSQPPSISVGTNQ